MCFWMDFYLSLINLSIGSTVNMMVLIFLLTLESTIIIIIFNLIYVAFSEALRTSVFSRTLCNQKIRAPHNATPASFHQPCIYKKCVCFCVCVRVLPAHDVPQLLQISWGEIAIVSVTALDVLFNAVQI